MSISHRLAQASILSLEFIEALGLIQLQPAVLRPPAIIGLLADRDAAAHLDDTESAASPTSISRSLPMICSAECFFLAIPTSLKEVQP